MAKPKIGLAFDDSMDRADGVQQQLRLMGRWLKQNSWPGVYLCSNTQHKQIEGLEVLSLSGARNIRANQNRLALPLPISSAQARQVLAQTEIDLLHIMLPYSPWLGGKLVKAALASNVPVLGTFHTYPASGLQRFGSRLYGKIYGRTLKRFSRLISVSEATADSVKRLYGLDSIVLPNFVDVSAFSSKREGPNDGLKRVVFVGRLVERKGPHYLIQALAWLQKKQALSGLRVDLVGDGPMRAQLEQQTRDLGLESIIRFAGFVDESSKAKFLAEADLAVYPASGGEAFGIVLLEAMAAGTLVLGGDNPGYRSVLSPEQLVSPADTAALARRITELLDDKKLRQKLLEAQDQKLSKYDYNQVMPQLAKHYSETLALRDNLYHTDTQEEV